SPGTVFQFDTLAAANTVRNAPTPRRERPRPRSAREVADEVGGGDAVDAVAVGARIEGVAGAAERQLEVVAEEGEPGGGVGGRELVEGGVGVVAGVDAGEPGQGLLLVAAAVDGEAMRAVAHVDDVAAGGGMDRGDVPQRRARARGGEVGEVAADVGERRAVAT